MRDKSVGHTDTFIFSIKLPVFHGAWIDTDDTFMSPGHELVPVHTMRDMSPGHTDTFTLCMKTLSMSWRLDVD